MSNHGYKNTVIIPLYSWGEKYSSLPQARVLLGFMALIYSDCDLHRSYVGLRAVAQI
ncbi:MAG: hypothetical protein WC966_11400 [Bradymonadales bacterium]